MTPSANFVVLGNCQPVDRSEIPDLPAGVFREAVIDACRRGWRVAALFGHAAAENGPVELYTVLADRADGVLHAAKTTLTENVYPAMTPDCPQVHLFEREIAEQYGVRPEGHPWFKPVRFVPSWRAGHDAWGRPPDEKPVVGVMDYYRVEGEEIHEVAVGPIHAGVIEPGHFRFQCHGELVYHLEISLGYQHRGVEKQLIGGPNKRTIHYMETLAGDTSVGHATAYCQAVEALAGCEPPLYAQRLRGVALELERLANHTGDLGALANDVAFLPTASYCGRLRGDFLNATAAICGSRFGRGLVRPGGVGFGLDDKQAEQLVGRLAPALKDVAGAARLSWDTPSVQARYEETGPVSRADCEAIGMVGVAARACGVDMDVRCDFPSGIFRFVQIPISTCHTGDVFARAFVRWLEIQRSGEYVVRTLRIAPSATLKTKVGDLKADAFVVSLVEGWRGEICHVALTNSVGRFARYKVVDPSFHNWYGLALALRNQQIFDFPLCNKSFNLSYCGHDL
jgi:Ni,Fe-hydrogenase III large subunit